MGHSAVAGIIIPTTMDALDPNAIPRKSSLRAEPLSRERQWMSPPVNSNGPAIRAATNGKTTGLQKRSQVGKSQTKTEPLWQRSVHAKRRSYSLEILVRSAEYSSTTFSSSTHENGCGGVLVATNFKIKNSSKLAWARCSSREMASRAS